MTDVELLGAYDAGYTNAIMELVNHIRAFVDKPNKQTKDILLILDSMLAIKGVPNE